MLVTLTYSGNTMPRVQKRKYEKIDEAEIDLVIQCNDSHEFYEKYREAFPTRKKGIDSISKIWKRRSEFVKKQQGSLPDQDAGTVSNQELVAMLSAQTKILSDMSGLMKEQLKVSKEILASLQSTDTKPVAAPRLPDAPKHDPVKHEPPKTPEQKEPAKKPHDKPPADIMIGS
ncbi:MAG: hypothetical protein WC379_17010 [Methanoregula sp.]